MRQSGTLAECLRAYAATLPRGTPNATTYRQDMKDFMKVSNATIERIISERNRLQGPTLLKLPRFLEFKGFKIEELEAMHKLVRELGDAVVFGITDVDT